MSLAYYGHVAIVSGVATGLRTEELETSGYVLGMLIEYCRNDLAGLMTLASSKRS